VAANGVKTDRRADLAVLYTDVSVAPALSVRASDAELGEDIVVFGFPYTRYLSSTPKLSIGVISATAGIRDNTSEYQISAPIQPGSSGGPVVGTDGSVVGVSVAMLNSEFVQKETGSLPQNVNFAVKGSVLRTFLSAHGIQIKPVPAANSRDRPTMARMVTKALFAIECWA
jgi:S1-C subfamily serine protease